MTVPKMRGQCVKEPVLISGDVGLHVGLYGAVFVASSIEQELFDNLIRNGMSTCFGKGHNKSVQLLRSYHTLCCTSQISMKPLVFKKRIFRNNCSFMAVWVPQQDLPTFFQQLLRFTFQKARLQELHVIPRI